MIGTAELDGLGNVIEQTQSVPGEEGQDRIEPFLQSLFWKDEIDQISGIGAGALGPAHGFARRLALDFSELVANFSTRVFESGGEGRVEGRQFGAESIQCAFDFLGGSVK